MYRLTEPGKNTRVDHFTGIEYNSPKESKAFLYSLQYNQCAGPLKQEVINGHISTRVWKKIK
jgi:hypothetical protein